VRDIGVDRPLLAFSLALTLFGLIVLYSAGQTDVPTAAAHAWQRQVVWSVVGMGLAAVVFRFSPRLLEWIAPLAYGASILLLLITLVIGKGVGTAVSSKSWIVVAGHPIGQPAELAKLAVVLMLARYLSGRREAPQSLRELIAPCLIAGVPFLLVVKQPDLGSALVFIGILFAMLFWANVRWTWLFLLASPVASLLLAFSTTSWAIWMIVLAILLLVWRPYVYEGIAIYLVNSIMGAIALPIWHKLAPYQQNRLLTFLNPEADPQKAGYHAIQSKVAIGAGGWFGNGYLHGAQKRLAFLPEQHTDFVFSVLGEELGFFGVMLAMILFFGLLLVLLRIARRSTEPFGSLLVFGILGLLFTHVFENMGMTVNVMPITGIPLPFFSYGGSFLLAMWICVGLALRVAWDSRLSGYADVWQ
jgi:rod shape determining protein RodA